MDDIATEIARADAARVRAENARATEEDDLKWLMSHKQGRRLISGLLNATGVFRSSFAGSDEMDFREWARNVGLRYFADITDLCPDQYVLMLKEHKEDA